MKLRLIIPAMFLLLGAGCEKELDLAEVTAGRFDPLDVSDTAYVEIDPPYVSTPGGEDLMIGNDQLLYVAETRNDRIVMMNRAGMVLSTRRMLRPQSLAQDSRLDLLVGGSVVTASGDTAGAIFRLRLYSAFPDSAHHLEVVPIDTIWIERAHPQRRFPGLTVFGNNTFLAVRSGNDNSSVIDPDSRILLFDASSRFITPLSAVNTRAGSGITDMYYPTSIASFSNEDFILVQNGLDVAYGALWLKREKSADFEGWLPKFDPALPSVAGVDFIRPGRFLAPEAVTLDRRRTEVFIADAGLDSIFKFNRNGAFRNESFGAARTGGALRRPTGLAFFELVLYVLDGETGLIHRFRLTTDVPR